MGVGKRDERPWANDVRVGHHICFEKPMTAAATMGDDHVKCRKERRHIEGDRVRPRCLLTTVSNDGIVCTIVTVRVRVSYD